MLLEGTVCVIQKETKSNIVYFLEEITYPFGSESTEYFCWGYMYILSYNALICILFSTNCCEIEVNVLSC